MVRGNTKPHKDRLINMYGKENPNLKGGPGWIFSKRHLVNMKLFVAEVNRGMTSSTIIKKPVKIIKSKPKVVEAPTTSKKHKVEKTVRSRYERELHKKLRRKWEAELETQMERRGNEVATEHQRKGSEMSSGALLGDHPNFSVGVNKGEYPIDPLPDELPMLMKVSRKRMSLIKCFIIVMALFLVALAVDVQMDYVEVPDGVGAGKRRDLVIF